MATQTTPSATREVNINLQQPQQKEEEEEEEFNEEEYCDYISADLICSEATLDRAKNCKYALAQYWFNLYRSLNERGERRRKLLQYMKKVGIPMQSQENYLKQLAEMETEFLRLRRVKLSNKQFESVKIIGRGAFGEVRLVRMKRTRDNYYAMKRLRKSDMIQKDQIGHVRAERDVLADCHHVFTKNPWVVSLYYAFQDTKYLYLIMEYIPGGDMMTMLIKYDTFSEDWTRFYIAETILAIDTIHQLGYVHRDIKPDNLLIDKDGHIKLSDFGLCTGLETNRFSKIFEQIQGQSTELESNWDPTSNVPNANWKKQRRELLYSTVGTPDYIAPEVFAQKGYDHICDWWSVGVIMFEMLVGYPPFHAENQRETYRKIMNWRKTLRFPEDCEISPIAKDLVLSLCCDSSQRLGRNGVEEIKAHPFFTGINWDTIREQKAPFIPQLTSLTDTRYFDEFEEIDDDEDSFPTIGTNGQVPKKPDFRFFGYTYNNFEAVRAHFGQFGTLKCMLFKNQY
eukprot:TRINITY_DN1224_c0_g1_i1.p1 TRINITY_DN1224_c0_g1~~TRINITY_DN1224_c0_g1_i1.p1  ORF type:complete len:511 (-),score=212.74 TRINITY_DN1224_c0_g1_i1:67-1599(-)